MILKKFRGGYDRNFCYLVANPEKEAIIIDPFDSKEIFDFLEKNDLNLLYIINTHSHFDHVQGNKMLVERTKAKIIMNEYSPLNGDVKTKDSEILNLKRIKVKFIYTPGHIKDGMCILINDKMLFTGDLLFVGKIGGTGGRFKGSDPEEQWKSLQKIMILDDKIKVYPGHNYGNKESSTIGNERKTNPFLLCRAYEEFVNLKENWYIYKKKYKIK